MKRSEFAALVERLAPPDCAFDWDNCGFNIALHDDIKKVLVCLDPTEAAAKAAAAAGADTVLSHHPLFFHAAKHIDAGEATGAAAAAMIRAGLNLYCAHTSYDCAPGGMNAALARRLGLENIRQVGSPALMTLGELPAETDAAALAALIKQRLSARTVRFCGAGAIKTVACIGGAGADEASAARAQGADALVTGEAKYNFFAEAKALGLSLFAAGHYETEHHFVSEMCHGLQMLKNELQLNLECLPYEGETCPYGAI